MSGAPFEFSIACDAAIGSPPPFEIVPDTRSNTRSVARVQGNPSWRTTRMLSTLRQMLGSATYPTKIARKAWQCQASGARGTRTVAVPRIPRALWALHPSTTRASLPRARPLSRRCARAAASRARASRFSRARGCRQARRSGSRRSGCA